MKHGGKGCELAGVPLKTALCLGPQRRSEITGVNPFDQGSKGAAGLMRGQAKRLKRPEAMHGKQD
jgi:hypothetical protein